MSSSRGLVQVDPLPEGGVFDGSRHSGQLQPISRVWLVAAVLLHGLCVSEPLEGLRYPNAHSLQITVHSASSVQNTRSFPKTFYVEIS